MKLEDQVCSLEQGIKLKELGVYQNSLFYYYRGLNEERHGIHPRSFFDGTTSLMAAYSLFTVAELGIMMPNNWISYFDGIHWHCYPAHAVGMVGLTQAEAMAFELISLLEIKLTTPEEVNKRLNK